MKALCFCLTAVNMCLLISIHATAQAQYDGPLHRTWGQMNWHERYTEQRRGC